MLLLLVRMTTGRYILVNFSSQWLNRLESRLDNVVLYCIVLYCIVNVATVIFFFFIANAHAIAINKIYKTPILCIIPMMDPKSK